MNIYKFYQKVYIKVKFLDNKKMVIKQISLDHNGGYYFYRIHKLKTEKLCNKFNELKGYLEEVFKNCPNDYFNNGPRSSSLTFKVPAKLIEVRGHEVSILAKYGLRENENRYKTDHSKVQVFMLERDNKTIAVEVPIWLKKEELECFKEIFKKEEEPLTGHIDVLRIDNDKIWIWDYKPNAKKEKYAVTQTYFYALMLSKRTGISLDNFRCGYFDNEFAFMFKPIKEMVINNSFLNKFL